MIAVTLSWTYSASKNGKLWLVQVLVCFFIDFNIA
jgi:hypothetical protein